MVTMTFDPQRRGPVSEAQALWWWRRLVRRLNEEIGGKHYRDKWGHSYFGYIAGVEYHKSGAVHMHAVVDNWIDFGLAHACWQAWNGWLWIRKCDQDPAAALRYVVKYVTKADQRPSWWFQREPRVIDPDTGRSFRVSSGPQANLSRPASSSGVLAAAPIRRPEGARARRAALTGKRGR
jgi:hypothetical protein